MNVLDRLYTPGLHHLHLHQEMTEEEQQLIQDLDKCDFGELHSMHKAKVEARRNKSKEEKLVSQSLPFFPPLLFSKCEERFFFFFPFSHKQG